MSFGFTEFVSILFYAIYCILELYLLPFFTARHPCSTSSLVSKKKKKRVSLLRWPLSIRKHVPWDSTVLIDKSEPTQWAGRHFNPKKIVHIYIFWANVPNVENKILKIINFRQKFKMVFINRILDVLSQSISFLIDS